MGKKMKKNWPAFSLVAYIIGILVGGICGTFYQFGDWGEFVSETILLCAFCVFVLTWLIWYNEEEKTSK